MLTQLFQRYKISHVVWAFVFFNLIMSHFVLPTYNNNKDFLFFSTWRLFSGGAREEIVDITWDGGLTYFFRDHRLMHWFSGMDKLTLLHLLQTYDFDRIRNDFLPILEDRCQCHQVEIHVLKGSFYNHIVLREPLVTKKVVKP